MFAQNQIKRTPSLTPAIAYVSGLLTAADDFVHRTELADFLCKQFDFHDARGHAQRDGCLKALRELDKAGHFALPATQGKPGPMTLLGREAPGLPAEVLFSDVELQTLRAYAQKKSLKPPVLLGEAFRMVAKIGDYLGRDSDPPPGHQLIWQGYSVLQFMALAFALGDT